PRTWARLEIDRLLAEDARKHKDAIVALSKRMYVMTPFTSLLVLENDDMYTQYKVDRGRKDHWAMYPAPATVKVVTEPLAGGAGDRRKGIKPSRKAVANSVVARVPVVDSPDGSKKAREMPPADSLGLGDRPTGTTLQTLLRDGLTNEFLMEDRAEAMDAR